MHMWYNKTMRKLLSTILVSIAIMMMVSVGIKKICGPFENGSNFNIPSSSKLNLGETVKDFFDSLSSIIPDENQESSSASSEIVGLYKVSYVIDGDTFLIEKDGERVKVRLIGVDTPESVASDEYLAKTGKQNVPEGKKASEFTTELLSGRSVYLEYDEQETDIYGRTLAYAYLNADKTEMVQELLLEAGMAKCMEVAPNTRYASYFKELEQTAKANNVGLWATDVWE